MARSDFDDGAARDVTRLLVSWRRGDDDALERLIPLVYDQLRDLASRLMRGERSDHTLRPTALVHEAYARISDGEMTLEDRNHFLSVSARVMRRVLVDHARAKLAEKRGGDALRVTLNDEIPQGSDSLGSIIDIDDALEELKEIDERKVEVIEMHYFAGMTVGEIAQRLDVSKMTVNRDLRFARAWLRRRLSGYEAE